MFQRADDEDRAGNANKYDVLLSTTNYSHMDRNTARTFYAAGTFFDILRQFGELEIDVRRLRIYFELRRHLNNCRYKKRSNIANLRQQIFSRPLKKDGHRNQEHPAKKLSRRSKPPRQHRYGLNDSICRPLGLIS